jgi:hypothetical protein
MLNSPQKIEGHRNQWRVVDVCLTLPAELVIIPTGADQVWLALIGYHGLVDQVWPAPVRVARPRRAGMHRADQGSTAIRPAPSADVKPLPCRGACFLTAASRHQSLETTMIPA